MINLHKILTSIKQILSIGLLGLILFCSQNSLAVQAYPGIQQQKQPDGSMIKYRIKGDEYQHWEEDIDGYTIVQNNGWYEYSVMDPKTGVIKPSGYRVGTANPSQLNLQKGIGQKSQQIKAQLKERADIKEKQQNKNSLSPLRNERYQFSRTSLNDLQQIAPIGTVKNLVVMVRFSNHTGRTLPSVSDVNILFNNNGSHPTLAPTGSIKDYYKEASYNQLNLDSTVTAWITVSNTEAYYANGDSGDSTLWQALREALTALDATIDFNDFDTDNDGVIDSIAFIHSGYGAEWGGIDADGTGFLDRIWSHRWAIQPSWTSAEGVSVGAYHISPSLWSTSGSDVGRIGVIAHETGHFFGLPDLYDTDNSGSGIGSFGLMANSWGFNFSQLYPPHLSAWSKTKLGWVTPTKISADGCQTIQQAESAPSYYKVSAGYPSGEYLLIENRQPAGFDGSMPQGGLVIFHIDDATTYNNEGYPGQIGWPNNGNHYRVAVLQADGNYDLEKDNNRGDAGDVYRSGGVTALIPGPNVFPNTDAYQAGAIIGVNHIINNISAASDNMSFCVDIGGGVIPTGTLSEAVEYDANWQTGGDANFFYRYGVGIRDNDSTENGAIDHNQASYIETTFDGPGTLSFSWKVSSEFDYDFLTLSRDEVFISEISGEIDWTNVNLDIPSGTHTVKWVYSKDSSVSNGSDRAWLDKVDYRDGVEDCDFFIIKSKNGNSVTVCL